MGRQIKNHYRNIVNAFNKPGRAISWRNAGWLLLAITGTQVFGQASLCDYTFGIGSGANDAVYTLIVQQNQRILAGGAFTSIGGQSNAYLARLNFDGSVDTSFNRPGQTDRMVSCMVQQPDGKVLVGGEFNRLLGVERHVLARLQEDDSVDPAFDAGAALGTNSFIYSLAVQPDGRILIGYATSDERSSGMSQIARIDACGAVDPTFVYTNPLPAYVFSLLPMPDGTILVGANPTVLDSRFGLFHLQTDGQLDEAFDPGLESGAVFCLVRKPSGHVLVGGQLKRMVASSSVPLLQLTPDLKWDESFKTDTFGMVANPMGPTIYALLLQPDGKIVAGGDFFEVGGYWRRQIVRFMPEGHVDGCFDPGLGLGGYGTEGAPVQTLGLQADGRILVGGKFYGSDTCFDHFNLTRLLPQSDCDQIRAYFIAYKSYPFAAAATFTPGGTNVLEYSENLKDWDVLDRTTNSYIYVDFPTTRVPQAFFRAKQER